MSEPPRRRSSRRKASTMAPKRPSLLVPLRITPRNFQKIWYDDDDSSGLDYTGSSMPASSYTAKEWREKFRGSSEELGAVEDDASPESKQRARGDSQSAEDPSVPEEAADPAATDTKDVDTSTEESEPLIHWGPLDCHFNAKVYSCGPMWKPYKLVAQIVHDERAKDIDLLTLKEDDYELSTAVPAEAQFIILVELGMAAYDGSVALWCKLHKSERAYAAYESKLTPVIAVMYNYTNLRPQGSLMEMYDAYVPQQYLVLQETLNRCYRYERFSYIVNLVKKAAEKAVLKGDEYKNPMGNNRKKTTTWRANVEEFFD